MIEFNNRHFDDDGDRVWESPLIEVEAAGEVLHLTWLNTVVRRFRDDPEFNHIEHIDSGGQLCGLTAPDEYLTSLEEAGYTMRLQSYIDDVSFEWMVHQTTKNLDQELGKLMLGQE